MSNQARRRSPSMAEANRRLYRASRTANRAATANLIFWTVAVAFMVLIALVFVAIGIWALVVIR